MELLLLAAEYARHADNPFAMMNGILSQWLAKDVRDADAARREHEARQAAGRGGAKPAAGATGATGGRRRPGRLERLSPAALFQGGAGGAV